MTWSPQGLPCSYEYSPETCFTYTSVAPRGGGRGPILLVIPILLAIPVPIPICPVPFLFFDVVHSEIREGPGYIL